MRATAILSIFALSFVCGCDLSTETSTSRTHTYTEEKPPVPEPPADAPVHKMTVREFYDQAEQDRAAVNIKYHRTWLELTGEVYEVFNKPKPIVIARAAAGPDDPIDRQHDYVTCYMKEAQPWETLKVGDTATFRGVNEDGMLFNVTIKDLQGGPTPEYSTEELLSRVSADLEPAREELHEQPAVLTGEVARIAVEEGMREFDAKLILKGDGTLELPVHYRDDQSQEFESLSVGDNVRLIGGLMVVHPDRVDAAKHRICLTRSHVLEVIE